MFDSQLHSKEEWALIVTALYYNHLNADPDFQADLAVLFERLADPLRQLEELAELTKNSASLYRQPYPFRPLTVREEPDAPVWWQNELAYWRLHNEAGMALSEFCERWHLPTEYGLRDLWHSLALYLVVVDRGHEYRLRLQMSTRAGWIPPVGHLVYTDGAEVNGERIVIGWHVPVIVPNVPVPFRYDPTEQSRAWLNQRIDAICDSVRQSIYNQADALESQGKAGGWENRPPRYTDNYLQRVARALYLRAVKGAKWEDVRKECDDDLVNLESFAERMRDWAKLCGIPL
jgi:hypothetical protein